MSLGELRDRLIESTELFSGLDRKYIDTTLDGMRQSKISKSDSTNPESSPISEPRNETVMASAEVKINADLDFHADHDRISDGLVNNVASTAKRIAADVESLLDDAPNRDHPEFDNNQIHRALHLSRDFAEYSVALARIAAMQQASRNFRGARDALPK